MTTARKIQPDSNDLIFNLATMHRFRSDLEDLTHYGSSWDRTPKGRYFVPAYLSGSDYSGSLVERSNHKVWCDTFAAGNDLWWFDACGGYSTFAVVVDSHSIPDDVLSEVEDFLGALSDYPVADDDVHSEMEREAESEAWINWGEREFIRALKACNPDMSDDDTDALESAEGPVLSEVFYSAGDRSGTYWRNEQGDSMYIDMARVAAEVSADELTDLIANGRARSAAE